MSDEMIRVIYLRVGKRAEICEIREELEDMQALVHGDIEEYMPFDDPVALVCNMESKNRGLPANREIVSEDGRRLDIMQGDFFLCYAREESEVYESLPPELEEKYRRKFEYPEQFFKVGEDIRAVKYDPEQISETRDESR